MQDVNMYSQAESDLDSYGFGFVLEFRRKALPAFRINMASTASKPELRLTMNVKTAPTKHL